MHNMPYLLKNANKFYAQICNLKYAEIKYMQHCSSLLRMSSLNIQKFVQMPTSKQNMQL